MSVEKIYEFTCEYCGCAINHLPFIPKTKKEYEECGIVYVKKMHFCNDMCYEEYCLKQKEKENE